MQDDQHKIAQASKAITILQVAFTAGPSIFASVVLFLVRPDVCEFTWQSSFTIAAASVTAACVAISYLLFQV